MKVKNSQKIFAIGTKIYILPSVKVNHCSSISLEKDHELIV